MLHIGTARLAGVAQQNSKPHARTPSASCQRRRSYFCFWARRKAAARAPSCAAGGEGGGGAAALPLPTPPEPAREPSPAAGSIGPDFIVRAIRLRARSTL